MLGITVADSIAFGMLILGVVAAIRGLNAGKAAKQIVPPPEPSMAMIGAAIVDRTTLQELTGAIKDLVVAIDKARDDRERHLQETIDRLLLKISDLEIRPRR